MMAKSSNPSASARTLDLESARRFMIEAQRFAKTDGPLTQVITTTGFVRTLGGVDVYLAFRARRPATSRDEVDMAAAAGELRVVPAARGCIYLVAEDQVDMALHLADRLSHRRNERDQAKAGIQPGELERVAESVEAVLKAEGPLTTHALRRTLGPDVIRSLGAAGKKVGVSSTLPPALRNLEFQGRIQRRVEGGRLDSERYCWQRAEGPEPGEHFDGPEALHDAVGRLFFTAAGLATQKALAAWSGLGQRDARGVIDRLGLVAVAVDGIDEEYWASESAWDQGADAIASRSLDDDWVAFLPFADNLVAFQQGPAFFVDPAFHGIEVPVWGRGRGTTLGDARHSSLRPIIAAGRLVGFWELDPDQGQVVQHCFDPRAKPLRSKIEAEAESLGRFLTDELGHGRSFSLDTEEALRRRAMHLQAMAKG